MTSETIRFEPLVGATLGRIGEKIQEEVPSISTPFPSWNGLCGEEGGREGIAHTWVVVVGGADGSGKSYLAINLAAHAVQQGEKVGFVNFEMTEAGLTQRYLSVLSGYPKYRLEHGKYFSRKAWLQAQGVADSLYEETGGCIITNASALFDLDDIVAAYARLADAGCNMICIDYAQLVQVGGKDGIFQRSEAVANELRVLTHKHKVVTVVVSQLNRDGKKLADTPPTRHYLQGGGAWENNANQIVLIDHTLQIKDRENDKKYTRIIMDKNRHGDMPVMIPVAWNLVNMRWDEEELPSSEEGSIEIAPVEEVAPHPHDEQFGEQQTFMEA